jgi:hypothetical protein
MSDSTSILRNLFYENIDNHEALNSPLFFDAVVRLIEFGADVNVSVFDDEEDKEGDIVRPLELTMDAYYALKDNALPNNIAEELIYYLLEKEAVVTDGAIGWASINGDKRMMEDLLRRVDAPGLLTVYNEDVFEVTQGFEQVVVVKEFE